MTEPAALVVGMEGEFTEVVTSGMLAAQFGNVGIDVLATPYLIWMIERAAVIAVRPGLAGGTAE